ncbi:MAG: hypothetical protein LBG27_09305 [Spirochaetaceae bacterium]|jgi:hypothetical protein|nr:hypothetical protein [Spirochaetaceae bacterium]
MRNNGYFFIGIIAVWAGIGLGFAGCDTGDDDGGGSVTTPEVINGFYGVTNNGKTIEVVIKNKAPTEKWTSGDDYFVYIDRIETSRGTITVTSGNGQIIFTSTDGSSVSAITITNPSAITVTKGGTTYSGKIVAAQDLYYCIGAATDASKAQIESVFAGKTPEQVYTWCSTTGTSLFLDYPESNIGTWNEMVRWAKGFAAPNAVINGIAGDLTGKVSAVGWYRWASEGYNIMFYISRMPLVNGKG